MEDHSQMKGKIPDDLLTIKIDDRSFSPYLKLKSIDGGSGLVSSTEDYLKFAQEYSMEAN